MENKKENPIEKLRKAGLSTGERIEMRESLVNFMRENPRQERSKKESFFLFAKRSQRIFAVLVIVAGVLGVINSSENALPGDPLYPVKVFLADPLNNIFKSGTQSSSNKSSNQDQMMEMIEPKNQAENGANGSQPEALEMKIETSETFPVEDSKEREAQTIQPSYGAPVDLIDTGASVVPESGRIKVILPNRYVVASVGETLEISWENNLFGGGYLNISISRNSYNIDQQGETTVIVSVYPVSGRSGTYNWPIPESFPEGYYKIQIWPPGAREVVGWSEEFAITLN